MQEERRGEKLEQSCAYQGEVFKNWPHFNLALLNRHKYFKMQICSITFMLLLDQF